MPYRLPAQNSGDCKSGTKPKRNKVSMRLWGEFNKIGSDGSGDGDGQRVWRFSHKVQNLSTS